MTRSSSRLKPRQIVFTPGSPSPLRAKKPPRRAIWRIRWRGGGTSRPRDAAQAIPGGAARPRTTRRLVGQPEQTPGHHRVGRHLAIQPRGRLQLQPLDPAAAFEHVKITLDEPSRGIPSHRLSGVGQRGDRQRRHQPPTHRFLPGGRVLLLDQDRRDCQVRQLLAAQVGRGRGDLQGREPDRQGRAAGGPRRAGPSNRRSPISGGPTDRPPGYPTQGKRSSPPPIAAVQRTTHDLGAWERVLIGSDDDLGVASLFGTSLSSRDLRIAGRPLPRPGEGYSPVQSPTSPSPRPGRRAPFRGPSRPRPPCGSCGSPPGLSCPAGSSSGWR